MLKKITSTGLVWLWLALLLILVDRATKYWVVHHLHLFEPLAVFPFFNITLAYNAGAAFSFLHTASGWQNWVFGGLALGMSGVIFVWLSRLSSRDCWMNITLCLIFTGALGNAWDRMLYGYVIDFLDFHLGDWHFAIFNIADSAICVGVCLLFWNGMRTKITCSV